MDFISNISSSSYIYHSLYYLHLWNRKCRDRKSVHVCSEALCNAFHKSALCRLSASSVMGMILFISFILQYYQKHDIGKIVSWMWNVTCKIAYISRPPFLWELFPLSIIRKLQLCSIKAVTLYLFDVLQEFVVKLFSAHLHVD